jgi:imidazolonepropionase-like amidohydrolase
MNAHTHICLDGSPDPLLTMGDESSTERAIRSARRLERTLHAGVTTIRDVGGLAALDIALARMIEQGELAGPRMIACGQVVTMTGGHGHWMGIEADGPDAVRRATRLQIKRGATAIKVMATGGMMTGQGAAGAVQLSTAEMMAAVEEAHHAGRRVAAHAESGPGILNALRAGVDSVEHGHGGTSEAVDLLLEGGASLVPTILSDARIIEHGVSEGIPRPVVDQCKRMTESLGIFLESAIDAGVRIAAGNDAGAPFVQAWEVVAELELLVRHGMSRQQALASATINAAHLFGLTSIGLVEPGHIADLVVVASNPLQDLGVLSRPLAVFKEGRAALPYVQGSRR